MAPREQSRNPSGSKIGQGAPAIKPVEDVYISFYVVRMESTGDFLPPMPGQRLARGAARMLRGLDHVVLPEFVPARGLRVDLMSLGPKGEFWIVECKSCRADFAGDRKWQNYLEWCDRYFWAVDCAFPAEMLPPGTGLIIADAYGAEVVRTAPETRLAPARRTRLMRDFARVSALRLHGLIDPGAFSAGVS